MRTKSCWRPSIPTWPIVSQPSLPSMEPLRVSSWPLNLSWLNSFFVDPKNWLLPILSIFCLPFGIDLGAPCNQSCSLDLQVVWFLFTVKNAPIYFGPHRFGLLVPLDDAQDPPAKKEPRPKAKAKAAAEPWMWCSTQPWVRAGFVWARVRNNSPEWPWDENLLDLYNIILGFITIIKKYVMS